LIGASKARFEPPPAGGRRAREDERLRLISEKLMSIFLARCGHVPPSKTKQKCFGLLGFIRPNGDFSVGYNDKK
jgi:hypothetical protein